MRAILTAPVLLVWVTVSAAGAPARADDQKRTEKTHTVNFEKAEWADVFDWYARATGLKAEARAKPKGTVTMKVKDRQFTHADITDLLNELLDGQDLLLIPGRETFVVVSGAEKIAPTLIRSADLAELPKLARTMLVEVTIPVAIDVNEEIASELKKLLTSRGELVSAKGKSIVVRDTVANIYRIRLSVET